MNDVQWTFCLFQVTFTNCSDVHLFKLVSPGSNVSNYFNGRSVNENDRPRFIENNMCGDVLNRSICILYCMIISMYLYIYVNYHENSNKKFG